MVKRKLDSYKGKLTPQQIADGMNAALENAKRLVEDAKTLLNAGRFPTAASRFVSRTASGSTGPAAASPGALSEHGGAAPLGQPPGHVWILQLPGRAIPLNTSGEGAGSNGQVLQRFRQGMECSERLAEGE